MKNALSICLIALIGAFVLAAQDKGLLNSAAESMKTGAYSAAVGYYAKAIEKSPAHAPAYYGRALAYSYLDKCVEAIDDYSKSLELDAKQAEAFYGRGLCLLKTGASAEALKDFDRAIALDGKKADYLYARGYANSALGKQTEAITNFDAALAMNPTLGAAYYARGAAYFRLAKYDKARPDLKRFLETAGDDDALRNEAKRLLDDIERIEGE